MSTTATPTQSHANSENSDTEYYSAHSQLEDDNKAVRSKTAGSQHLFDLSEEEELSEPIILTSKRPYDCLNHAGKAVGSISQRGFGGGERRRHHGGGSVDGGEAHASKRARLSELLEVTRQAPNPKANTKFCRRHDTEVIERVKHQRANRRYQHNARLPIHSIPLEIFAYILSLVECGLKPWRLYQQHINQVLNLASVARYWRQAVTFTPQLWSFFQNGMDSTHLRLSTARSRLSLIDVDFHDNRDYFERRVFIQTVASLSHRWRSLGGVSLPPREALEKLRSHAPALQYLRLQSDQFAVTHVDIGEGGPLHSLELSYVTIPWNSNRLSGLCILSLVGLMGSNAPTLRQVILMLVSSPTLEELVLYRLSLVAKVDDQLPEMIDLPNLISLRFYDIPYHAHNSLFSLLRLPLRSCKTMRLNPAYRRSDGVGNKKFNHCMDKFVQQVAGIAKTGRFASIRFGMGTVELEILKGDIDTSWTAVPQFSLALEVGDAEEDSYCDIVAELGKLVAKAIPDLPLRLIPSERMRGGFHVDLLHAFDSARKIIFPSSIFDACAILQFLCQPSIGMEEWPCPGLTHLDLSLVRGCAVRDIHELIKGRWVKWEVLPGILQVGEKLNGSIEVIMPGGNARTAETWVRLATGGRRRRGMWMTEQME
ncbi:hypothetical protein FRB93_007530 [Tulasnella sp. JGI-2019a]|nr:hypothetical protein FRB93_007530 [Tulasnella sp. JGI-2019a]